MKTKIILEFDIETVDVLENRDAVATVTYPNEANPRISIKKGLNTLEFSEAIHHEIGHLFDWYLSQGKQSEQVYIREENAVVIGENMRMRGNCEG